MLAITVRMSESFDESTSKFVSTEEFTFELEHSLASLSKWESFFEIPFLSDKSKTEEQLRWYLRAMIITPDVPEAVLENLTNAQMNEVSDYINAKMTATWFMDTGPKKPAREVITAELIYYWMVSLQIPFECQHWHLNRLFTLIKVCSEKNAPPKKLSRAEIAERNRAMNKARREQYNTTG